MTRRGARRTNALVVRVKTQKQYPVSSIHDVRLIDEVACMVKAKLASRFHCHRVKWRNAVAGSTCQPTGREARKTRTPSSQSSQETNASTFARTKHSQNRLQWCGTEHAGLGGIPHLIIHQSLHVHPMSFNRVIFQKVWSYGAFVLLYFSKTYHVWRHRRRNLPNPCLGKELR